MDIIKGDLTLIYKALRKEWDNEFTCIEKGEYIELNHYIDNL